MEHAAKAMNVEASFTGTTGVDVASQAHMIVEAVRNGYDGIAANLIHPHAFDEAICYARRMGVPVVAFNTDAGLHSGRLSVVGQNYLSAGRELGTRVARSLRSRRTVLVTMHDGGVLSLEQRCASITEELAKRSIPWKIAIAHSTAEGSAARIAELLTEDPSIQFICASGLADTEGAGLAIERNGLQGKLHVAGFDLSPEILRMIGTGVIYFTIDQQPYAQGYYPVVQLALYCRYGIRPSDIDTGAAVVTRRSLRADSHLSVLGVR
jgi:simple sugar transport system substrate-binding protein